MHASQWNTLVHDRCQAGHVFTDIDARNIGVNRFKFASDLGRRIHLQVVHVLVPRSTAHINHDDRFVRISDSDSLFCFE